MNKRFLEIEVKSEQNMIIASLSPSYLFHESIKAFESLGYNIFSKDLEKFSIFVRKEEWMGKKLLLKFSENPEGSKIAFKGASMLFDKDLNLLLKMEIHITVLDKALAQRVDIFNKR